MLLISFVSVLNLLYFYISTFRSKCAVANTAVFCSSLTSCFPGMLLTYFLNDFEIVPVAPVITGIIFVPVIIIIIIIIISALTFFSKISIGASTGGSKLMFLPAANYQLRTLKCLLVHSLN